MGDRSRCRSEGSLCADADIPRISRFAMAVTAAWGFEVHLLRDPTGAFRTRRMTNRPPNDTGLQRYERWYKETL